MPWGPLVAGGVAAAGSIGSGILGANAAGDAAKMQQASQRQTLDWLQQVYGKTKQNLQPFIGAGTQALPALQSFYGLPGGRGSGAIGQYQQFTQTPFYQFPLQQANLATKRALAASGLTGSGGELRDLSQLNAGYASQGLGQYLAGLTGMIGTGQNAATSLGGIGTQTGSLIGAANTNFGNAGAQGIYNSANSMNRGVQNALPFLTGGSGGGGTGQSSYGSPYGGGGLIGQAYSSLYNPVSSLFSYGNTGGYGDAGTSSLQGMGFLPPSIGGTY